MPIFKIIVVLKIMQITKNFTVRISNDVLIFQADLTMTRSGKTLEAGPEKKDENFYGSRNSPNLFCRLGKSTIVQVRTSF